MILNILRPFAPDVTSEHRFHPTRRWRFDYAIPSQRLAIEIDGGVFTGGRHSGGVGQIKDMEKLNAAAVLGWRVLRYTPGQLKDGTWIRDVRAILAASPEPSGTAG